MGMLRNPRVKVPSENVAYTPQYICNRAKAAMEDFRKWINMEHSMGTGGDGWRHRHGQRHPRWSLRQQPRPRVSDEGHDMLGSRASTFQVCGFAYLVQGEEGHEKPG